MRHLSSILFIALIQKGFHYPTACTKGRYLVWVEMVSAMWHFMPIKNLGTASCMAMRHRLMKKEEFPSPTSQETVPSGGLLTGRRWKFFLFHQPVPHRHT